MIDEVDLASLLGENFCERKMLIRFAMLKESHLASKRVPEARWSEQVIDLQRRRSQSLRSFLGGLLSQSAFAGWPTKRSAADKDDAAKIVLII
jgi:hypothetical protein